MTREAAPSFSSDADYGVQKMGVAWSHGSCFRDRQFGLFTSVKIYRRLKLTLYMQAKFLCTHDKYEKRV